MIEPELEPMRFLVAQDRDFHMIPCSASCMSRSIGEEGVKPLFHIIDLGSVCTGLSLTENGGKPLVVRGISPGPHRVGTQE